MWSIASHHPEAVNAVCSLNVPYWSLERGLDELIKHVDRSLYPADMFPAGQWEYQKQVLVFSTINMLCVCARVCVCVCLYAHPDIHAVPFQSSNVI